MSKTILVAHEWPIYVIGVADLIERYSPQMTVKMARTPAEAIPHLRGGIYAMLLATNMIGMRDWRSLRATLAAEPLLLIEQGYYEHSHMDGLNVRARFSQDIKRDDAFREISTFLARVGIH